MTDKKIAIIHYWFISWRGGEKVVESLLKIYPNADVYTHILAGKDCVNALKNHNVHQTFVSRLPWAKKHYQKYLPIMPLALEQLDLRKYDVVISSESGPAKGVLINPNALHICYCHSPMRYLWDMYQDYRETAGWFTKKLMPLLTHYLRMWDQNSANRVDFFIANSDFIRRRINKTYRRDAEVIYPPVAVEDFTFQAEKDDYYLMLGQLTYYKRADLAVDAFAERPDRRLVVIGEGELLEELKKRNLPNVELMGRQPFSVVKEHLENSKALIFPGVEDFGIVPVEAMACGTPVIAFGRGGVLETVKDGVTGVHFSEQTTESLLQAIKDFEEWEPRMERAFLRAHAETFSDKVFSAKMQEFIEQRWNEDHLH
ncbi:glycosyltransferase [Cobetia sp. UCD-24C]|uniref:glycosyltransferase n=1 Tax=Cobetia sp. UCD-24C TaxID=1716176 RepID=UPI0009E86683|nr:glycosyltransferase [Cobetia sp. UCD-24C]